MEEEDMRQLIFIVLLVPLILCWPVSGHTQQVQSHSPTHMAQLQPQKSRADELLLGVASPLASAIFFPIKLSVGALGSALGGVSGFATGGSARAAEGIWWPTVRGHYFVTPEVLEGKETLFPPDPQPVARPLGLIRTQAYIHSSSMHTMQLPTGMPVSNPAHLEAIQQQADQAQRAESALQAAQAASEEAKQAARVAESAAEKSVRAAEGSIAQ
jgi:hypothetical protein